MARNEPKRCQCRNRSYIGVVCLIWRVVRVCLPTMYIVGNVQYSMHYLQCVIQGLLTAMRRTMGVDCSGFCNMCCLQCVTHLWGLEDWLEAPYGCGRFPQLQRLLNHTYDCHIHYSITIYTYINALMSGLHVCLVCHSKRTMYRKHLSSRAPCCSALECLIGFQSAERMNSCCVSKPLICQALGKAI